jgi:UDP-glucose 4-epimerase
MKILITGGAGFIGSNLSRAYLERGDDVYIIDNLSTGRIENISSLLKEFPKKLNFTNDTILNDDVMMEYAGTCDMIIHLAAAVGVKYIIDNPLESMETNIVGTEHVMKWARKFKKKVFIASSSEVYGDQVKAPLDEEDSVVYGPSVKLRWSYAASKLVDEFLALAYYRTINLPVVICRFFNVIGPNQTGDYGMVVPRFIERAVKNEPIPVFGDGSQSRTFTHIDDVVWAVMKMMETPECVGEIMNLGGEEEITIRELAERVIGLSGSDSSIASIPYEKVYTKDFDDMRRRVPSLNKIKRLIGYSPRFALNDALKQLIDMAGGKKKS